MSNLELLANARQASSLSKKSSGVVNPEDLGIGQPLELSQDPEVQDPLYYSYLSRCISVRQDELSALEKSSAPPQHILPHITSQLSVIDLYRPERGKKGARVQMTAEEIEVALEDIQGELSEQFNGVFKEVREIKDRWEKSGLKLPVGFWSFVIDISFVGRLHPMRDYCLARGKVEEYDYMAGYGFFRDRPDLDYFWTTIENEPIICVSFGNHLALVKVTN